MPVDIRPRHIRTKSCGPYQARLFNKDYANRLFFVVIVATKVRKIEALSRDKEPLLHSFNKLNYN